MKSTYEEIEMDLLKKMPLMIANLDMVLETLQPLQQSIMNAAGQGENLIIVDDYYNLMLALEKTKEAKERLTAVFQKLQMDR